MSTIKLEIEVSAENAGHVMKFIGDIAYGTANAKDITVTDAEEVKATAKTPPKARPSRAKAKPEPEPEEEEDEDFADGLLDDEAEEESEDDDITEDTLRELSAKKIGKHKDAIIAELKKFKVKGWANLPEKHYAHMQAFLIKLK